MPDDPHHDVLHLLRRRGLAQKDAEILDRCRGRTVLDVGCVGQDRGPESPRWLHRRVAGVAAGIDGVDVDREGIERLRAAGFRVHHAEDLAELDPQVEVVLMGDVIEHVDSPVELLATYARYLAPGGRMLVTTPNPHRFRDALHILLRDDYPLNPEHTCWLCPRTALETARRAGLAVVDFRWLDESYRPADLPFAERWLQRVARLAAWLRTNWSPAFLLVLERR